MRIMLFEYHGYKESYFNRETEEIINSHKENKYIFTIQILIT
jgi:hypothetical protein